MLTARPVLAGGDRGAAASAQRNPSFGVLAGGNASQLYLLSDYDSSWRLGGTLGLYISIPVTARLPRWALRPEIVFSDRGADNIEKSGFTLGEYRIDYKGIRLLFDYKRALAGSPWHLALVMGPTLEFRSGRQHDNGRFLQLDNQLEGVEVGFHTGIGVGWKNWSLELRGQLGATEIGQGSAETLPSASVSALLTWHIALDNRSASGSPTSLQQIAELEAELEGVKRDLEKYKKELSGPAKGGEKTGEHDVASSDHGPTKSGNDPANDSDDAVKQCRPDARSRYGFRDANGCPSDQIPREFAPMQLNGEEHPRLFTAVLDDDDDKNLTPASKKALKSAVRALEGQPDMHIKISGYTCILKNGKVDTEGLDRAKKVRAFLKDNEIKIRMEVGSHGAILYKGSRCARKYRAVTFKMLEVKRSFSPPANATVPVRAEITSRRAVP